MCVLCVKKMYACVYILRMSWTHLCVYRLVFNVYVHICVYVLCVMWIYVCVYVCVKCVCACVGVGMYNTSLGDQPIPGQQQHYHHYMLLYAKPLTISCPDI